MAFLHHSTSDGTQQPPLEAAPGDIERHLVLEHNREYIRDFERVEIHLPLPPRFRGIEIIDPTSPWDDDGYEESLASQVPNADPLSMHLTAMFCHRATAARPRRRVTGN